MVDSAHAGRAAAGRSVVRILGRRFAAAFAAWSAIVADRVVTDRMIARHGQRADRRRCSVALLGWAEVASRRRRDAELCRRIVRGGAATVNPTVVCRAVLCGWFGYARRINGFARALSGAMKRRDAAFLNNLIARILPAWLLYLRRQKHYKKVHSFFRSERPQRRVLVGCIVYRSSPRHMIGCHLTRLT